MSILAKKYFHDEEAAFEYVEQVLWKHGPECPHCGSVDNSFRLKGVRNKPNAAQRKKGEPGSERHGLWKCGDCRKQYTVRKGTIFEESHLPMTKWLQAFFLICSSKKGISSHQLHRVLEVQYKTAWFLSHRIREAMRSGELTPFGGGGGMVEVDETYIGSNPDAPPNKMPIRNMNAVLTLVDRESGKARSMVVDHMSAANVAPLVAANLAREARLMTDQAKMYKVISRAYADHQTVNHFKKEFVRKGQPEIHTNTVEGYFSVFKRGMRGVYQHCSSKHLHRYLAEFDFRYNHRIKNGFDDSSRARAAIVGVAGKRLMYRDSSSAEGARLA